MKHARHYGVAAAILGALAVALGAFGAHALRNQVPADSLVTWRTAVDYQFWHALAVLGLAAFAGRLADAADSAIRRPLRIAAVAFVVGIVLFSGSLYALVLGAPRWIGAITPIGGVALIAAWLALGVAFWRSR